MLRQQGAPGEKAALVEAKEVVSPDRNVEELGIVQIGPWLQAGSASDSNKEKTLVDVVDLSEPNTRREYRKRPKNQLPTVARRIYRPVGVQHLDGPIPVRHKAGVVEQVHEYPSSPIPLLSANDRAHPRPRMITAAVGCSLCLDDTCSTPRSPTQARYPDIISSAFRRPRIVRSPASSLARTTRCSSTTVENFLMIARPSCTLTW